MNKDIKITIGTRGSVLALMQADIVRKKLLAIHDSIEIKTKIIKTTGDKIQDRNLYDIGGKALFTKEIEEQLISGQIDLAVHSLKDVPAFFSPKLAIPCVLERKYPLDAFISNKCQSIEELPQNAVIGTSSPRRAAQTFSLRPDLKIVQFRGNVQTRLNKLEKGDVDATFLAMSGIKRLSISEENIYQIDKNIMVPAVAQGAIGLQVCKENQFINDLIQPLNHFQTFQCVKAERMFLKEMNGSCRTPIGAYAQIKDDDMVVDYMYADENNYDRIFKTQRTTSIDASWNEAIEAAKQLKEDANL